MGDEVLEEDEFEPMFSSCEAKLPGKKIGLLDPMAGEMENGCTTGKINAEKMEHFLSQMV